MSILWIYDKPIDPQAGGTERATHLVMTGLAARGYPTAGFLAFRQDHPRAVFDPNGAPVEDLYAYLQAHEVETVVNQIGFSKWLLEEFLARGGERWKEEGGKVITCLHFGPPMFLETVWALTRDWREKSLRRKVKRLGRIALLPVSRRNVTNIRKQAYAYLIEKSDVFVLLSEMHRLELEAMCPVRHPERVRVIPNPNTFAAALPAERVKDKTKTVLIVSRLEDTQKRVSLALRAWGLVMRTGEFGDWNLQVVGDGEHAQDYWNLVARKRIPNVAFIGRTDPEPYYESASLYLHTAIHEGWGLTITEAMQKGTVPIVMNSSSVFREIIDDGRTGILTNFGNVEAFAAQIANLMRDRALRESMALAAIEASQQHDLDRVVEKFFEVLKTTADTASEPCPSKFR
ncbi:glycosyltransferase [Acuticoccus kandeliae]|uniref:glycosyltransferase n=1 Tax=Acuticoccus kandeliae TaxID=2073160 RepID=UPI000D3ED3EE|nr:glycosyltransferase [Acuticoccus kandeliae]